MGGMLFNLFTVALGSMVGLLLGNRLPERVQASIMTGLGLVTFVVGLGNANQTGNILIPAISLVIGVLIGEALRIDRALERFGGWLQTHLGGSAAADARERADARARFINGFITASLLFCVGPLTFVGSLQDGMGLAAGFQQIAIKSVLDGFAAVAFAASLGIGVAFSLITILIVQGGLSLLGALLGQFMTTPQIAEMAAAGGLMLMALALALLDIKRPPVANFLPALVIAPLIVAVGTALGINLYPL